MPHVALKKDRLFYLKYDGAWLVFLLAFLGVMEFFQIAPLAPEWTPWFWIAIPLAAYGQMLATALIHNGVHGNIPKPFNRWASELLGLLVITRYASWQVVHFIHHSFSDDRVRDPHPAFKNYWKFCWNTIFRVEERLQAYFFECHGDTPENRLYEKRRAWLSYAVMAVLLLSWYRLLGFAGFVGIFVPAQILGFLFLMHFNWSTHNALYTDTDFKPINLKPLRYQIGNALLIGIYAHENHHRYPKVFNPAKIRSKPAMAAEEKDPSLQGA